MISILFYVHVYGSLNETEMMASCRMTHEVLKKIGERTGRKRLGEARRHMHRRRKEKTSRAKQSRAGQDQNKRRKEKKSKVK